MTLKSRVLLLIAAVHLVVILGAGAVMLLNARHAVALEITAARDSVVVLIRDLVTRRADTVETLVAELGSGIVQPRHVRIRFIPADSAAPLNVTAPNPGTAEFPGWFLSWVSPEIAPVLIAVTAPDGTPRGSVEVAATPEDEAEEVWGDVAVLFPVWIAATLALLSMLAVLVGRALAPLAHLEQTLTRMQSGDYSRRAAATESPDLRQICARIDQLATSLQTSEEDRRALSRRLLELRDSERKTLARELHDELGPCLFGLSVMAEQLRSVPADATERADDIDTLVARVRSTNRRILETLRPATIGNLPLRDVLTDLVGEFQDTHPATRFQLDSSDALPATSEIVDITLYRVLQEALTNALRHGKARDIRISLAQAAADALRLTIVDDGTGLAPGWCDGRGLLGMRERIVALNGSLVLRASDDGRGTVLIATVPCS